jgi:drug/metabolite transporter (DMT)-like permease
LTVTVVSLAVLVPLGLVMSPFEPWRPVTGPALLYCLGSAVTLSVAYVLIVLAMRFGEVAVVAPFRYTFLLWAIVIQVVVFAVWPDALTLAGSAALAATGLYTVYRERKVKGPAKAQLTAPPATVPPPT